MALKNGLRAFAAVAAFFLVGCEESPLTRLEEKGECAVGDMIMNFEDSLVYVCGTDNKWEVLNGDEDGKKDDNGPSTSDLIVASYDDLVLCTAGREGAVAYVKDEKTEYVCSNNDWVPADATDSPGSNGASSKAGSSAAKSSSSSEGANPGSGLGACSGNNNGKIKWGIDSLSSNRAGYYVCDNGDWRTATVSEKEVGFGCTSSNVGMEKLSAGYMVCSSPGVWVASAHTVAGTMTDSRDGGKTYKTIGIGTQTWMAENLNYEYKVAGSTYGNWCYRDSVQYCARYGRLYTWDAAMDSATTGCDYYYDKACMESSETVQGVCPDGWHLPSRAEWYVLMTAVGGVATAGTMLKADEGWYGDGCGTDAYGFSALPSGFRCDDNSYSSEAYSTLFWSSDVSGQIDAYRIYLSYGYEDVSISSGRKSCAYPIRCVKD